MPIRYAEVTVILEETFARSMWLLTGYECAISKNDTIIVSFENEERPYHTKTECECVEPALQFADKCDKGFPIYFYKQGGKTFISKLDAGDFLCTKILKKNVKVNNSMFLPSTYNIVYYFASQDLFAMVRLKSNEFKPRFAVAYDDKELEKHDVIYLVHNFLTKSWY